MFGFSGNGKGPSVSRSVIGCWLCVEGVCARSFPWWLMDSLWPVVRMHLLPRIDGPH